MKECNNITLNFSFLALIEVEQEALLFSAHIKPQPCVQSWGFKKYF